MNVKTFGGSLDSTEVVMDDFAVVVGAGLEVGVVETFFVVLLVVIGNGLRIVVEDGGLEIPVTLVSEGFDVFGTLLIVGSEVVEASEDVEEVAGLDVVWLVLCSSPFPAERASTNLRKSFVGIRASEKSRENVLLAEWYPKVLVLSAREATVEPVAHASWFTPPELSSPPSH